MTDNAIPTQEVEVVQAQTSAVIATAQFITIENDPDLEGASRFLKGIADTKKSIEARRQFFVRPLNEQVKNINELFRDLLSPLDSADMTVRGKVNTYRSAQAEAVRREQERLNQLARQEQARLNEIARKEQERLDKLAAKEQAKADKKAEKKGEEAPTILAPVVTAPVVPVAVIAAPATTVGNMVGRKVWRFKVTDQAAVPRAYLIVHETAIREAVRSGIRDIPGVSIFQEEEVTIR